MFHCDIKANESNIVVFCKETNHTLSQSWAGLVIKMLSLPFPSPDTVTIATRVFQSGRSVQRGTEVPFWKEWEGSAAWEVVSWWLFFPREGSSFVIIILSTWHCSEQRDLLGCRKIHTHKIYINIYIQNHLFIFSSVENIAFRSCFVCVCVFTAKDYVSPTVY